MTNLVKCRPLGNRTPRPDEIAACKPYLQRQIALLKPQRILALGRLAAQAVLEVDAELDALRGQVHQVRRSEEHTSELQSLMRISYAVFCLKKKKKTRTSTQI